MNRIARIKFKRHGFTLVELLLSMSVLALLLTLVAQVIGQSQRAWSRQASRVTQYREARRAFDRIVRNLSQAVMNPYLQYVYSGNDPRVPSTVDNGLFDTPDGYARFSELQFISGRADALVGGDGLSGHAVFFQAPLGSTNLAASIPSALVPVGFFVRKSSDLNLRPSFLNEAGLSERSRYRLYEFRSLAEENRIYDPSEIDNQARTGRTGAFWAEGAGAPARVHPLAENILVLVLAPRRAADGNGDPYDIAPNFEYNSSRNRLSANQSPSDYQLPPMVDVVMVSVDENSAERLDREHSGERFDSGFRQSGEKNIRADIENMEKTLNSLKLNYRVFTSTVPIRGSRW